jgi:hypothetical protein
MDSAQHIVTLEPSAVELVDRTMIDLARDNPAFRPVIDSALIGEPKAILLVEFSGDDRAALLKRLESLVELMGDLGAPGSVVRMTEDAPQKALWEVRKAGLNIMMSLKGDGKPVSFIEDCAVPLAHLADYTDALTEVFRRHGSAAPGTRHASVGTLHVRPILDMRRDGAPKMRAIADEAPCWCASSRAPYSGEHGDGLCRGEWIRWQFGPRLTRRRSRDQAALDPINLMNPGQDHRPAEDGRCAPVPLPRRLQDDPLTPVFDWSAWNVQNDPRHRANDAAGQRRRPSGGFAKAVEMCNNNGHCRKFDAGTMCPSYRVTRDEQHLTRGAPTLCGWRLSGQLGAGRLHQRCGGRCAGPVRRLQRLQTRLPDRRRHGEDEARVQAQRRQPWACSLEDG